MRKFEYKVLAVPTNRSWFGWGGKVNFQELSEVLNELGRDGWEVINGTDINRYQGETGNVMIILKRPLSDN
jgi:hypothetical protein